MPAKQIQRCKWILGLSSGFLFVAFLIFIGVGQGLSGTDQAGMNAVSTRVGRNLCVSSEEVLDFHESGAKSSLKFKESKRYKRSIDSSLAGQSKKPGWKDRGRSVQGKVSHTWSKGSQSKVVENRIRRSEMVGPYAPMVYDLLVETSLENRLVSLGIIEPDEQLHLELLKALPGRFPVPGRISSGFGVRKSPFSRQSVMHRGVDVSVPRGTPVSATGDGVVTYSGWLNGYGKLVEIDHGYGIVSRYGHNERILVELGERISSGQAIARSGSSGRSTGPHVHYEVAINGQEVDPTLVMFPHAASLIGRAEPRPGLEGDDLELAIGGESEGITLDQQVFQAVSDQSPELLESVPLMAINSLTTGFFGLMSCGLIFLVRKKAL